MPANVSLQVEMRVTTACFGVHYEMLLIYCILEVDKKKTLKQKFCRQERDMAADVFQNRADGRVAVLFQTILCDSPSPLFYMFCCATIQTSEPPFITA